MNHVAMLIPGIDRLGGAERQVLQLARGLREHKWQVTVIVLSGTGGEAGPQLIAADVDFFSLRMRKGLADPSGWIRLHRWLRRNKPDVVHAHLPHAAWMARWSRLAAPVRIVLDTVHTSSPGTVGRQLGYRFSGWLADAVTAVSEGAADAYLTARMVARDRLVVIPNGVNTRVWKSLPLRRESIRKEFGFHGEFIWLAAGRLEPVKNYPSLLDALAQLPMCAHLVIAGTGPMEEELRERCAALGVASRVTFLGFERDLMRWMRAADAFVLPSLWEGLPLALLEAGACSLPAVATDVPGSREVLVSGETGLLAKPGSVGALADSMMAIMQMDPAARDDLGRNARQNVIARFSLEAALDRWEALYRDLLHNSPSASRAGRAQSGRSGLNPLAPHANHHPQ
jgi:glycosyltransferase involved in cell wall biosynthesis